MIKLKKTTKNKKGALSVSDPLKNMQHPHPWRSIGRGLLIIFGIIFVVGWVYTAYTDHQELKRFQGIDEKLTAIAKTVGSIESIGVADVRKENTCTHKNAGIRSWILCGTYVRFSAAVSTQDEQLASIRQALLLENDMDMSFSEEKLRQDLSSGSGDIAFIVNGEKCIGYWKSADSQAIKYTLYCVEEASKILPGYEDNRKKYVW